MRPSDFATSLAREGDEVAQRVVGVRVVHDHGEGLAGVDGLEAAGDRGEAWNRSYELIERNAARVGGSEGGEQVEDVDFTGEMRGDCARSRLAFQAGWLRRRA